MIKPPKVYSEIEDSPEEVGRSRRRTRQRIESPAANAEVRSNMLHSMDDMWIKVKYGIERATLTAAWNLGFKNKKHDYRQYTEKRFREVIVGVQAQLHSKKRSFGLYYYVKTGDLDKVQQLIARDDTLIGKRDAAGAAAFHLAYVFQHYHVGHYLVEQYPELAIEPYNGHQADEILDEFPELNNPEFTDAMMPYTGATILHIAIVRRNFEEVRWLLNYYYSHRDTVPDGLSRILSANVTGKFFAADGDFYLGGLPLHFAVCANHMGIFDIIMSYASRVRLVLPELYLIPGDESSKKSFASGAAGDGDKNDGTSGSAHVQNEVFSMSDKGGLFHLPHLLGASDKLAPTAAAHHTDAKEETKRDSSHPTGEESLSPGSLKVQSDRTKKRTIAGQNMLFLSDMQGNTVLHLCVRYGLQEMYAHIFRTAQRILTAEIKQLYAAYAHKGVGAVVRLQEIPHTPYGFTMLPKVINIPERDKYEEWVRAETEAKLDERLLLALNSDLHSTLTLAAAIIRRSDSETTREKRIAMLQNLLQYNKTPLWSYGAIKVSRMKLEGIEIKYKLERYQNVPEHKHALPRHAAIDWLCINDADPRVILLPEIRSFIETKWERVGYPSFLVRFVLNTFMTVLITLIMLYPYASPWIGDQSGIVVLVDILYPMVLAVFGWMLVCEMIDFLHHGRFYLAFRGVARYDKIVRVVKVASFLLFAIYKSSSMMHAEEENGQVTIPSATDHVLKVSLTVCVMSSWLHVYYFLMGFDSTGPFMLTIFRIVGRNVPYFLRFYAVIVVTFACGLSLLANNGTMQAGYGWMNLLTALWTLLQVTVGAEPTHNSIDIQSDIAPHLYWLADILLTMYYASVVILMINLLIAMIGHTYEEYISYNFALLLIEKYNIMHAVERSMGKREYEHYRSQYSHRVKVIIDSLVVSNNGNSLKRAVSGAFLGNSAKGSAKGNGEFAKHVTIESSNYDFELQEVNEAWFSTAAAQADAARSRAVCREDAHRTLFLICPQQDYYPGGAMPVETTDASAHNIAALLRTHGGRIRRVIVAMATHQYGDLTHSSTWENYQGEQPTVGERITYKALLDGDWQARTAALQEWFEQYTKRLEGEHKRTLMILPEHCIVGTVGHGVHPAIDAALQQWAHHSPYSVQYIHYGSNKRTFMYSAMQAAVEDPLDASTTLNVGLLNALLESDQVLLAGPDLSGSVRDTVQSLVSNWGQDLSRLVILKDGGGMAKAAEAETAAFYKQCQSQGCTVKTCAEAVQLGPESLL